MNILSFSDSINTTIAASLSTLGAYLHWLPTAMDNKLMKIYKAITIIKVLILSPPSSTPSIPKIG
jgi:hypothetical protein